MLPCYDLFASVILKLNSEYSIWFQKLFPQLRWFSVSARHLENCQITSSIRCYAQNSWSALKSAFMFDWTNGSVITTRFTPQFFVRITIQLPYITLHTNSGRHNSTPICTRTRPRLLSLQFWKWLPTTPCLHSHPLPLASHLAPLSRSRCPVFVAQLVTFSLSTLHQVFGRLLITLTLLGYVAGSYISSPTTRASRKSAIEIALSKKNSMTTV